MERRHIAIGFIVLSMIILLARVPDWIIHVVDSFNYLAFILVFAAALFFLSDSAKYLFKDKREITKTLIFAGSIALIYAFFIFFVHDNEITGRKTMFSSWFDGNLGELNPRSYFKLIPASLDLVGISITISAYSVFSRIVAIMAVVTLFLILSRHLNRYLAAALSLFIAVNSRFIFAATSYECAIMLSALAMCIAILSFDAYTDEKDRRKASSLRITAMSFALLSSYLKTEMVFFLIIPLSILFLIENKKEDKKGKKDYRAHIPEIVFFSLSFLIMLISIYQVFELPGSLREDGSSEMRSITNIMDSVSAKFPDGLNHVHLIIKLSFIVIALANLAVLIIIATRKKKENKPATAILTSLMLSIYLGSYFLVTAEFVPVNYAISIITLIGITIALSWKYYLNKEIIAFALAVLLVLSYSAFNTSRSGKENLYGYYDGISSLSKNMDPGCRLVKYIDSRYPYFDLIVGEDIKTVKYYTIFGDGTAQGHQDLNNKCFYLFIADYSEYSTHDDLVPSITDQMDILKGFINAGCSISGREDVLFEKKDSSLVKIRC